MIKGYVLLGIGILAFVLAEGIYQTISSFYLGPPFGITIQVLLLLAAGLVFIFGGLWFIEREHKPQKK